MSYRKTRTRRRRRRRNSRKTKKRGGVKRKKSRVISNREFEAKTKCNLLKNKINILCINQDIEKLDKHLLLFSQLESQPRDITNI
tara:strand:+ start:187 stop:441 length:255 start_codon:yes stop_codon:yes gene_type:complete